MAADKAARPCATKPQPRRRRLFSSSWVFCWHSRLSIMSCQSAGRRGTLVLCCICKVFSLHAACQQAKVPHIHCALLQQSRARLRNNLIIATMKTSAADLVAQCVIEQKPVYEVDWKRNLAAQPQKHSWLTLCHSLPSCPVPCHRATNVCSVHQGPPDARTLQKFPLLEGCVWETTCAIWGML